MQDHIIIVTHYTLNDIFLTTDLLITMTHKDTSQNSQGLPFIPISSALFPPAIDAHTLSVTTMYLVSQICFPLSHLHAFAHAVSLVRMSLLSVLLVSVSSKV